MSYEDWKKHGDSWKKILDKIQPLVEELARNWNAEVTREGADTPQFELRWCTDDGLYRSIQIIVEQDYGSYYLRIAGSAWKDFEEERKRIWRTEDIGHRISIRAEEPIQSSYEQILKEEAYPLVSEWKESDLHKQDPLPNHSADVTEDMIEQEKDEKLAESAREIAAKIKEMVRLVD